MFKLSLRDILVFLLPETSSRVLHTFFCPPLRIVGLDDRGQTVFDQIVSEWRLVKTPPCRIILEMNPRVDYRRYLPEILSEAFAVVG